MNIKIGANIKKLRTENNIARTRRHSHKRNTQATHAGNQEGGYPDIELLPV